MKRLALLLITTICAASPAVATAHDEAQTFPITTKVAGQSIPGEVIVEAHDTHDAPAAPRVAVRAAAPTAIPVIIDLPDTWNCQVTHEDNRANAISNGPDIKVIYAYPTDKGNQLMTGAAGQRWADAIQQMVEKSMNNVAQANPSGSRSAGRTLRYDLGTPCGSTLVDIQALALPRASWQYDTANSLNLFEQLKQDVLAKTGTPASRNQVVFVDGLNTDSLPGGLAATPIDDRAGDGNPAQLGGNIAFIWPHGDPTAPQGENLYGHNALDGAARTWTHEVLHMLGAVQKSAPNGTPDGHSRQNDDIMSAGLGATACGNMNDDSFYEMDCGGEDYFNPAPAAGSYLATHWNIAHSVFLCPVSRCATPSRVPFGRIDANYTSVGVGQTVTFSAASSNDADNDQIVRFQWDLNNDGLYESEGPTAAASWPDAGVRAVRLRVTDATGEFSIQTSQVTVVAAPQQQRPPVQQPVPNPPVGGGNSGGGNTNLGGGNNGGGTPKPRPAAWSFNIDGTAKKQTGKKVVKSGVRVSGTATKKGTITVTLYKGSTKIGSGKIAAKGGSFAQYIKLTSAGKKQLKKRPVKVKITASGASVNDTVTINVTK